MQCLYPQSKTNDRGKLYEHPCGQCMPCRIRHRQGWAARVLLESMDHPSSVFCTLTYDQANYPVDGNLEKEELQGFIKRLRGRLGDRKIRYFACGEYGDRTGRAHYHAILFNCDGGDEKCIRESWKKGYVMVSEMCPAHAEYVAKYTLKKNTWPDSSPDGRVKEFALMSRRPGIGCTIVEKLQAASRQGNFRLSCYHSSEDQESQTTAIFGGSLRVSGRLLPIHRYIKDKLRKTEGFDENLYRKSQEDRLLETQGGSVFQEVLRRADAKVSAKAKVKRNLALLRAKGKL